MVKRVLVTTALEETWPDDKPVLFLGEWCKRFSRRDKWSAMDAETVPYHWDDRDKLYKDYLDLKALYERLLPDLAAKLNEIHGKAHTARYWRIVVGPWLYCFVEVLYDRWFSIRTAVEEHDVLRALILEQADGHPRVANTMAEYTDLILDDLGNEQLCAGILEQCHGVECETVPSSEGRRENTHMCPPPAKSLVKALASKLYDGLSALLTRSSDAVLFLTYLPLRDEKKLALRIGQFPNFWRTPAVEAMNPDPSFRGWVLEGQSASDFETCARRLIATFMPTVHLEGYEKIQDQAKALPWPTEPKFIFTSMAHNSDEVFKVWAAEKVEGGSRLFIGQHGGQYGIGRWVALEDHEVAIADKFLTWGWTDAHHPSVTPVAQFKAKKPLGVDHGKQAGALLITASVPRYSYYMRSITVARQWLDYFDDQCAFISALPAHIRKAMTVRLYHSDYGWDQEQRWRERCGDVNIDTGKDAIEDQFRQSRVVISTYNATTYLETFTMDIPTVMFWNPEHWELRDDAIPFFEQLERAGIFHQTPQSAADHLAAVWDDVEGWWKSAAVRAVVDSFSERYSRVVSDISRELECALIGVGEEPGHRMQQGA